MVQPLSVITLHCWIHMVLQNGLVAQPHTLDTAGSSLSSDFEHHVVLLVFVGVDAWILAGWFPYTRSHAEPLACRCRSATAC